MAGKRITELPSAGLLQPGDMFPIARGTQTLHISGQVLASKQDLKDAMSKYYFSTDGTFVVNSSQNNLTVVLSGQDNIGSPFFISINDEDHEFFELGFTITFISIADSTFPVVYTDHGADYGYIDPVTQIGLRQSYNLQGSNPVIERLESLKLIHLYPGLWFLTAAFGYTPDSGTGGGIVVDDDTSGTGTVVDDITDPTIVIDTTGSILDLVQINGDPLDSLPIGTSGYISINGEAAYFGAVTISKTVNGITATAVYTSTTLTINFNNQTPSSGSVYKFKTTATVPNTLAVSVINANGQTGTYNFTTSTLTID